MKRFLLLVALLGIPAMMLEAQEVAQEVDGITRYMQMFGVEYSIGSLTPTVCELCDIPKPNRSTASTVTPVVELAKKTLADQKVERTLIFCGDALGDELVQAFPADFEPIQKISDFMAKGTCVMKSVTPVCFSTIFTGAPPEVHGIQVYERPVQKTDTLFDTFLRSGKRVAIVAQNQCSVDLIFRERDLDYYSLRDDERAFQCAKKLIAGGDYDLLICYDGGYDSAMHRHGIHSEQALAAMRDTLRRYQELVAEVDKHWNGSHRLTVFISDHGAHDASPGKGSHGTEQKADMVVDHFYRIRAKN